MLEPQEIEALSGARVLVVDDEQTVRHFVKAGLEALGCLVETACDGRQALEVLLETEFDVALVDIRMERMDGFAFLVEALRIRPWLAVVIITGYVDNSTTTRANELGITSLVPKPLDLYQLREKISGELRKQRQRVEMPAVVSVERFQYELEVLRRLTRSAIESETLSDALATLAVGFGHILPASAIAILSLEEQPTAVLHVREPVSEKFLDSIENNLRLRYRALSGQQLPDHVHIEVTGVGRVDDGPERVVTCQTAPIISTGEIKGLLTLASLSEGTFSETDMAFLYHAANHVTAVLIAFRRMKQLAIRDCVTHLYSRRYVLHQLDYMEALCKRLKLKMGVALIQLDGFDEVIKDHGAAVGDDVLAEIGSLLAESSRAADVAGRYSTSQLLILLPGTPMDGAITFGQRIIDRIGHHAFCAKTRDIRLTASIAVTSIEEPETAPPQDQILAQLGEGLLSTQETGGHVVVPVKC